MLNAPNLLRSLASYPSTVLIEIPITRAMCCGFLPYKSRNRTSDSRAVSFKVSRSATDLNVVEVDNPVARQTQ
ncbi:Uncharacterised protein [Vibrio cholerae]|uniref:Uncharacterized protein n=1 Tax=Vibrio cholerae TaxID=666 RepID=A0A655WTC6_VIBCL|nr:Uncharacterised protein [Vibrio cholerae]